MRKLSASIAAVAFAVGMAVSPLATGVASAQSTGSVTIDRPALEAAFNAGLPVYEVANVDMWCGQLSFRCTPQTDAHYVRVHDHSALASPTAKYVLVGAGLPDDFWATVNAPGQRSAVKGAPWYLPNENRVPEYMGPRQYNWYPPINIVLLGAPATQPGGVGTIVAYQQGLFPDDFLVHSHVNGNDWRSSW